MAAKLSEWLQSWIWELLLKFTLAAFPAFALSVLGLFVWTVKQIHNHDTALQNLKTEWVSHDKEANEYKERIRQIEKSFIEFRIYQEQSRSDLRQVDQSVKTLSAQLDIQTRQMVTQAEKSSELREKMLNVQVALDSLTAKLHEKGN